MKKFLLLALLPLFLISCGDDDKNSFTGPVESTITKNELESAPSFTYKDFSNNVLSIKFRNGKLYTKEVTSSGFVCNENVMTYSLNGEKIDIEFTINSSDVHFEGTIKKIIKEGETNKLKLNLNQSTYSTAQWLSHTYEWSTSTF